ncbi:hypothetical protein D3C77_703930 [compost metagenome]
MAIAAHSSNRNKPPSQANCSATGMGLATWTNCGRKAVKIRIALGLPAATRNSWRARRKAPCWRSVLWLTVATGARHNCQAI